jgi:hypothetical protein
MLVCEMRKPRGAHHGSRLRRRVRRATVALLLGALALGVTSGSAAAEAGFTDVLGDGRGAPDILSAAVSHDADGVFTFIVLAFGGVVPPDDVRVTLLLDTDRNPATGSDGSDYAFQMDFSDNTHVVGRWDGSNFVSFDAPTAAVRWTAISLMFTINRSDLGGAGGFDFWIRSHRGALGSGQTDDAPDTGTWSYTASAPEIAKIRYPSTLKAQTGKVLDARGVRLQLSDGTVVVPERLVCRLTAAGAALRELRGGCRWQIPNRLKGRTIVLTLAARFGDDELSVTRRLTVR